MKPRIWALVAILMALALVVSACAPAAAPAAPTTQPPEASEPAETEQEPAEADVPAEPLSIVVATDASFPPMEYVDENKEIVGFDIDLMVAIAERVGLEVEFKNTAWDGIFAGLESGAYDAILSSVTITPERQEVYDFSVPYINAGQAVVVLADETEIASDQDLPGKTAGAQIGTTGALVIQEMDDVTLREYDSIDLAFFDLLNGNLDAVVVDTPVAADFALASDQFAGKLKIVGEPFTDEYYGLLVRKGEMKDLLDLFGEGLEQIKADGTYDRIYAKWISGDMPETAGS